MTKENISWEFRLKSIEGTRNFFINEIDPIELISNNNKKVCKILNYIAHFHAFVFAVPECISLSAFASLVNVPTEIMISTKYLYNSSIQLGDISTFCLLGY